MSDKSPVSPGCRPPPLAYQNPCLTERLRFFPKALKSNTYVAGKSICLELFHARPAHGSRRVTAPLGQQPLEHRQAAAVASNRLASITTFPSIFETESRNGASRRVLPTGASVISISRPSERYLTRVLVAKWPTIGS